MLSQEFMVLYFLTLFFQRVLFMHRFKCPSCQEESISIKDKFRLGWWLTTRCGQCETRVAAFPWTLMLLFFLHTWNVIWWFGLYHFEGGGQYLLYMGIGWVLIELINLFFMPLCSLRRKTES